MTGTSEPLPVRLIDQPQFKPGFLYGLSLPACVIDLQLAPDTHPFLDRFEDRISSYLGRPETLRSSTDDPKTRSVQQIVSWIIEVQIRSGLALDHKFHLKRFTLQENGSALITVVLPYRYAEASNAALVIVINLINYLARDRLTAEILSDLSETRKKHISKFSDPGQNLPLVLKSALAKGVPFRPVAGQIYRFGIGARQQILESTFTEQTSVIGARLSRNKLASAALLCEAGLPGGSPVRVGSAEDAIAHAKRIGYPVVVKPVDADGGRGVSANIVNAEDVSAAFRSARDISEHVLIDRHVEGNGHRITIMFGRVVKVTTKMPWGVTGDGTSTIAELVERQAATNIQDSTPSLYPRNSFSLDDEALSLLRQVNLTPSSIPASNAFVALRRKNNSNAGGTTVRLSLDEVHKDNLELALRISKMFLLDIAGIDLIVGDISRPWIEQDCLVCDVNSMPQIDSATAQQFLSDSIPGTGRIPITLILSSNKIAPLDHSKLLRHLQRIGVDGIASTDSILIKGVHALRACSNGYACALSLLCQKDVSNAGIFLTVSEINQAGLPFDRFQRLFLVRSHSSGSRKSGEFAVHAAGQTSFQAVTEDLLKLELIDDYEQASRFTEEIWAHFFSDL